MSLFLKILLVYVTLNLTIACWWVWLSLKRRRNQDVRDLVLQLQKLTDSVYGCLTEDQQVEYDLAINKLRRLTDERQ